MIQVLIVEVRVDTIFYSYSMLFMVEPIAIIITGYGGRRIRGYSTLPFIDAGEVIAILLLRRRIVFTPFLGHYIYHFLHLLFESRK